MNAVNEKRVSSLVDVMSESNMYLERAQVVAEMLSNYFGFTADCSRDEDALILHDYDRARKMFEIVFDYLLQVKDTHGELSDIINSIDAEERQEGNVL